MSEAASANEPGDRSGLIGRMFWLSHAAGQYRRRFKRWSPMGYQVVRAALVIGVVAGLIVL